MKKYKLTDLNVILNKKTAHFNWVYNHIIGEIVDNDCLFFTDILNILSKDWEDKYITIGKKTFTKLKTADLLNLLESNNIMIRELDFFARYLELFFCLYSYQFFLYTLEHEEFNSFNKHKINKFIENLSDRFFNCIYHLDEGDVINIVVENRKHFDIYKSIYDKKIDMELLYDKIIIFCRNNDKYCKIMKIDKTIAKEKIVNSDEYNKLISCADKNRDIDYKSVKTELRQLIKLYNKERGFIVSYIREVDKTIRENDFLTIFKPGKTTSKLIDKCKCYKKFCFDSSGLIINEKMRLQDIFNKMFILQDLLDKKKKK